MVYVVINALHNSSPRTRRYFLLDQDTPGPWELFSAHAEVFPMNAYTCYQGQPLLRARGGISGWKYSRPSWDNSSPRTRRYFRNTRRR